MTSYNLISFYYLIVPTISLYLIFSFTVFFAVPLHVLYFLYHDHEFQKTQHLERSPTNPVIIFPSTSSSKPPSTFLLPASWQVFFWSYPLKIHVIIYVFLFMCFNS